MQQDTDPDQHRRQLEDIAKTLDSHLLNNPRDNNPSFNSQPLGQPSRLPVAEPRRVYEQVIRGGKGATPSGGGVGAAKSSPRVVSNKQPQPSERRGLSRPYVRQTPIAQANLNHTAIPNDPGAENAAAWQARIANQIVSPRTSGEGHVMLQGNQPSLQHKKVTPAPAFPKTDFIAKNKDGL